MTFREAVELVNATLDANVTVVEVANMREVIEAGSVEKAQSLDVFRRRTFDDEVEDGDILVLTPGELHEVHEGILGAVSFGNMYFQNSLIPRVRQLYLRLAQQQKLVGKVCSLPKSAKDPKKQSICRAKPPEIWQVPRNIDIQACRFPITRPKDLTCNCGYELIRKNCFVLC